MNTKFALRTNDQAWIKRNSGQVDSDGRVTVLVPAAEVERIKFAGRDWLRHTLADCPRDFPNATAMCPAIWVEAAEVTAQRPQALDGKALFLAKMGL